MSTPTYTYFLAHAGADTDQARALYALLSPDVSVFLDCVDLQPGDDWDIELPKRQRQSLATIALLSNATEAAYYLREEIASAIAYQRHDPATHRLIPVFLDGQPADPARVPYGVRIKHSLDVKQLGLSGVAQALKREVPLTAATRTIQPEPDPARPPKPLDRIAIYEALCRVLPVKFDILLLYANAPKHELAPASEPLARRALDLIQWAEFESPGGLEALVGVIRRVAPGVLR